MDDIEHLRIAIVAEVNRIVLAIEKLILVEEMHHKTTSALFHRLNSIEEKIDKLTNLN